VNFEIRLFENSTNFAIVYGATPGGGAATVGVESADARSTQISCNAAVLASGLKEAATFNASEQAGAHTQDVEIDKLPLADTNAPVGAQITAPAAGPQLEPTFTVAWTASDTSPPLHYNVRKQIAPYNAAFGAFTAFQTNTTATNAPYTATEGDTECFGVQAIDNFGNTSAYSASRCFGTPLDDRSLTPVGGWTNGTGATSSYVRGTFATSTSQNATLTTPSLRAKYVAVIADTCPTCGTIEVYRGATYLKTFLLTSSSLKHKQVLVAYNSSLQTGAITVKVISSFGGQVVIDGIIAMQVTPP
jgi:hypothetical protein